MPKFITKPKNIDTMEHEDIRFETEISGAPSPTVEWYTGDTKLEPSDHIIYEEDKPKYALVVKDVKADEAGMFTVKATNPQGQMSASARLKVTRK